MTVGESRIGRIPRHEDVAGAFENPQSATSNDRTCRLA